MNKSTNPPRWYRPWRQAETRVQDDPADLGTCFGLELSLSTQPAPTKTAAEVARRGGWMQRFTTKRRAAA